MAKHLLHGRWILRRDQYHHFKIVHRPPTEHRNADGLNKRNIDYVHRGKIIQTLSEVSSGFSFMTQEDYEELPAVPYFDEHGPLLPDHSDLSAEARARLPALYILRKVYQDKHHPTIDLMIPSHGIQLRPLTKIKDRIVFLV